TESGGRKEHLVLPGLSKNEGGITWYQKPVDTPFTGYLGVDVGSTSTKAVIMDEAGLTVVAKYYTMTAGRPLDAIKEVFNNLKDNVGDYVTIKGVGVTGSGRYLVGNFIGADVVKNEITAQTRAAADIDADADIIEIGGQDSKLVIKRNGIVVDYQMNKACAAGTGSFIDELADLLGISVKNGDFASLSFKASHTIDLGTRCAAFMSQAVAAALQDGVGKDVITASLASSIARNYLSKVVGQRKFGRKIILTGAVFYNNAVVSAFREALPGKKIIVAEHKEVTGAIGAALLAKENNAGLESGFKGFTSVIESKPALSTFACNLCDYNCTISRLKTGGEKPTFFGSRCDLYDSNLIQDKRTTAFDEREKLLFREFREKKGSGPSVGIPRALMIFDLAPLFLGFLNHLDVRVVLSNKTNNTIIERSVELGYADSCFPVKLLHGHAENLKDVDFILFPSAIRLGEKEGDENQKYACPLVQASPYIIRQVLGLKSKLLVPTLDFSLGTAEVVRNLVDIAKALGFGQKEGEAAALAGLEAQATFEKSLAAEGEKLLKSIEESGNLGVVLLARSYVSQDSGANMGIAEKLAQMGVVPVPLDYLPLSTIDAKKYSDRPYWISESKHIAAAAIIAANPSLYGLMLSNFGCGPNSFIVNIVEDIMGGKPLGQLEVDEHAAEAGIVTRLEAFVDTIRGFHASSRLNLTPVDLKKIYRGSPKTINRKKVMLVPRMSPHADVFCAAAQSFGANVVGLPEPDERNLLYSNDVTSGKECLPYRVTLGDFIRFFKDNGHEKFDVDGIEGFTAGAYGPCRLGKYALEQTRILRELGYGIPVGSTVSNNGYRDFNLGKNFERVAWRGFVAVDFLEKMKRRTRPYERNAGDADRLFNIYLAKVTDRIRKQQSYTGVLREAKREFKSLVDPAQPRRPLVGINGEIFLRSSRFSNKDLEVTCEKVGLEVMVAPMSEWVEYIYYRNLEDAVKEKKFKKMLVATIKRWVLLKDEHSISRHFGDFIDVKDLSTEKILEFSGKYLSPRCGSEAVLSIGTGIEWMENPGIAGVISVMPHGCMPGGIVAAVSSSISAEYRKPWLSLTYDGFPENTNLAKINSFAEAIKY
ncbi:MAG: acyl-CoA dehydratase activase-related protein, partial [Dehalococcoidia bacterium]|nr:acyl-CoA dehydratase activase-related protein [Dehalococcoidia bacterium]